MKVLLQLQRDEGEKKMTFLDERIVIGWNQIEINPAKILCNFDVILAAFSVWQQCQRVEGEQIHPGQEPGADPQLHRLC
jgi:hypothetical protein